eukprot:g9339.t1
MAGCLEASDTIEKELASPRYPEVTAAGCAIPYGLTEQGCATIEMEAPEATGLFPQSTEEFAEVSATRSERSELQGVAEAGVPKPMREPKKKAKKARKRETKVEANAKATEAVEAEFGQAEIKVEVAEPIKAKEGCIYRIENAGALVQAERKSIARGALDVIPKGSTLTGELVPGIFEEGDRVEIKDDSKTFKKNICNCCHGLPSVMKVHVSSWRILTPVYLIVFLLVGAPFPAAALLAVLLPSVVVELSLNWKTALAVLLAALCSHQVAEAPMALVGARFFRDFAVSRLGTLAYRSPLCP